MQMVHVQIVEVKPDNNDIKPEPEVQHFCDQCDHKTKWKGNLKRHVEAQHEGLYYCCDQCDYKAKQKGQIKQHVKAKHEGVCYSCDQCDYKTACKSNLNQHVKAKHEGVHYLCDQCDTRLHGRKPDLKNDIQNPSFYGSNLWNLFSLSSERLYKSWNIAVRISFNFPRTTHCYFIEPLSQCLHPKIMLCSRFVKFYKTLTTCKKPAVRILARLCENNMQTVFGNTMLVASKTMSWSLFLVLFKSILNTVWRTPRRCCYRCD